MMSNQMMAASDQPQYQSLPSSPERVPSTPETITSAPPPPPHLIIPQTPTDDVRSTLQRRFPGSLHLTPCTLQQYQDFSHDHNDPYDLVDGLLVSMPPTDDPEHANLCYWLPSLLQYLPTEQRRKIQAYPERPLRLSGGNVVLLGSEETSAPKSPGAHSSSRTEDTFRCSDFVVVDRENGSEASDLPISPFAPDRRRTPSEKKAIMVGEITSTNRMKDLKHRLREYEREKIPQYVIFDRHKLLKQRNPCVEVHKLDGRTGKYPKKVYSKKEKVGCSFFSHWELTADQMLDYKHIRDLFYKEQRKMYRHEERANHMESEIKRLKEERDQVAAYIKANKKGATVPKCLQLDETYLKHSTTSSEREQASRSPTSPTSPPHRVRKFDQSDVKTSSHNSRKSHGSGKKR